MTANFMVILMRARGCALLRVVIVHHETGVDNPWYPTEQRQNDAQKETRDASCHQHGKRRKYHAEKILERFHKLFLSPLLFGFLSLLFADSSFSNS